MMQFLSENNRTWPRAISIVSVAVGLFASASAWANQKVNDTLDVDTNSYIEIEHINGKIEVIGWDKAQVKVEGELGEKTEEFIFERHGKDVTIKVEVEPYRYNWREENYGSFGDNLVVHVPHGAKISYNAVNAGASFSDISGGLGVEMINGDIDLNNISGRTRLESVNGDIRFSKQTGDLRIETVNGDISGDHEDSRELAIESVNGNINVTTNSEEVRTETVNGRIKLMLDKIRELDVNTVNGRVDATMQLLSGGDIRADSVGGSIDLFFRDPLSARFDIEAHAGGKITNNLSGETMKKAKYGPRRWLEFAYGEGAAKVEISTVSGKVSVNRAE